MKGTVAVADALGQTAEILSQNGIGVVSMDEAENSDAVVFSTMSDYQNIYQEDLSGDSGVQLINGDIRNPQEVLVLVLNHMGLRD